MPQYIYCLPRLNSRAGGRGPKLLFTSVILLIKVCKSPTVHSVHSELLAGSISGRRMTVGLAKPALYIIQNMMEYGGVLHAATTSLPIKRRITSTRSFRPLQYVFKWYIFSKPNKENQLFSASRFRYHSDLHAPSVPRTDPRHLHKL